MRLSSTRSDGPELRLSLPLVSVFFDTKPSAKAELMESLIPSIALVSVSQVRLNFS